VFGVSCDELLDYAEANRHEWEVKGKGIVADFVTRRECEDGDVVLKHSSSGGKYVTTESVNKVLGPDVSPDVSQDMVKNIATAAMSIVNEPTTCSAA
jgi:hypothetical protein